MHIFLRFTRVFFTLMSLCLMTLFMVSRGTGTLFHNALIGVAMGLGFSAVLIGVDHVSRRLNLRAFNITVLGLFAGYLMGQALLHIFHAILQVSSISLHLPSYLLEIANISLLLLGVYMGMVMTLRSSGEFHISIPFVRLNPSSQKRRDLILDSSALCDPRLLDLCMTGLLDHSLILPRFILKEIQRDVEVGDESMQNRGIKALELMKRLKEIPGLCISIQETNFEEVKTPFHKLLRLSRLLEANILTGESHNIQTQSIESTKIITIQALANALKPMMEAGEQIEIKIQRLGREPRQGVGYLEDGTMVVVNGGGHYVGDVIDVQILSVKHTSSGRMIFCNALEEEPPTSGEPS